MSDDALHACIARHLAHAATVSRLDDDLGTHHGLSWADFVLLTALDAAPDATAATATATATDLARSLCMPASRLLQQLLPLEKIGLLERTPDSHGKRRIQLRPRGRRLLRDARETAANACVR
jgi:DNA-binding MarR family transcriptional regulator